jgi:hypothetical protein
MNSNASLRNYTTEVCLIPDCMFVFAYHLRRIQRAVNLSLVLENIAQTQNFSNYNIHVMDCPITQGVSGVVFCNSLF